MNEDTANISAIIAMAWCDKTSFEDIQLQTGYSERHVIVLMRKHLKARSFRLWRKRVTGRTRKHRRRCEHLRQPRKELL